MVETGQSHYLYYYDVPAADNHTVAICILLYDRWQSYGVL